jgi:hypothetical protein
MWRPLARTDVRDDRAVVLNATADLNTATGAESAGSGIFRGLRAALSKRKHETSTEITPETNAVPVRASIEVTPGDGPSRFQFLDVRNLGKDAVFHATGQIVSSQNTNSALTSVYPLGWGHSRDAWVAIPKGDSRQILIATIGELYAGSLFHMALIQAGPHMERHWARWNAEDKLPLPRFGLKVSIIAEGTEESWTGYWSVTPENQEWTGVRLTFRGRQGSVGVL